MFLIYDKTLEDIKLDYTSLTCRHMNPLQVYILSKSHVFACIPFAHTFLVPKTKQLPVFFTTCIYR